MPTAEPTSCHLRIWRQGWAVAADTTSLGDAPRPRLDQGAVLLADHELVADPEGEVLQEEESEDADHQGR